MNSGRCMGTGVIKSRNVPCTLLALDSWAEQPAYCYAQLPGYVRVCM